jgi:hypothetical protein
MLRATANMCVVLFFICLPTAAQAVAVPDHSYPRTINPFLQWTLTREEARSLARWDVVILDMEIQARAPQLLKDMRRWNPDIVLLVYVVLLYAILEILLVLCEGTLREVFQMIGT